jgi:hypothetical protein
MLMDDVIPQLLELERGHHHSSVPQELNHLPVDTDRPSRCHGLRDDRANLAPERFDVDTSRGLNLAKTSAASSHTTTCSPSARGRSIPAAANRAPNARR